MTTTSIQKWGRMAAIVAVLVLVLSACASKSEVGSSVGVAGEGGGEGALRDPKATTTSAPLDINNPGTPTTQGSQSAGIGGGQGGGGARTPAPTQPDETEDNGPATTSTTEAEETFEILIQEDTAGHFMEPLILQAPTGATITWKNVSNKTRAVQASGGQFASPDIPVGGTFSWTADAPAGTINYKDTTRPYSSAQIQLY